MVFLHAHGVSTSRAVRIFKTYGQEAIAVVQENPYRLARDIRGIGFLSADTIAQKVGIALDSPMRAQAGVSYALVEASGQGHCGLPHAELVTLAVELLKIPGEIIERAIAQEVADEVLVADTVDQQPCVFLAPLYFAERSIAEQVKRLSTGEPTWPAADAGKAIPWVERKLGIALAASQKDAVSLALSSKLLVITGGPGVGKTTLVKSILTILRAKQVRALLCAPTGRAAKRLSESSDRSVQAHAGFTTGLRSVGRRRVLHDRCAAGQPTAQGRARPRCGDIRRRRRSTALGRTGPVLGRSDRIRRGSGHTSDRGVSPGGNVAHRARRPPD
jgi:exodeoxyribonuclease V alpha subunit